MAFLRLDMPIYLYGFSNFISTVDKDRKLRAAGYKVLGYIDRNAGKIRKDSDITCYTLDEIPESIDARKNIQVVIMLQNAALHEKVRESLMAAGFERILYAPVKIESDNDIAMLKSYQYFFEDDYEEAGIYEIAEVPADKIYVNKSARIESIRLMDSKEYRSIIEYGMGIDTDLTKYLSFMGKDDKEFLEDRIALVKRLKELYDKTPQYFTYAAAHAEKEQDRYIIVDGCHRTAFLIYAGEEKICLRVKRVKG